MLSASNLSVQFGKRILFDNVNIKFTPGNCYGIIGANGSGKSTFLKILSGKMEANSGNISLEPGKRLSVLEQDHNSHNEYTIIDTVLRGNKILYDIKNEMENIYSKSDFSDKDGERVGELQARDGKRKSKICTKPNWRTTYWRRKNRPIQLSFCQKI